MSSAGATLQGSFSGETGTITETGFYYGTSAGNLPTKVAAAGTSSPFSKSITGLTQGTTYYYKAYVIEDGEYRYGSESSFVTKYNWLEMPSYTTSAMSGTTTSSLSDLYKVTHSAMMGGKTQRNYTMLYDPEMFASYWVAYPLCSAHLTTGRTESWAYDPAVPEGKQAKAKNGYGVSLSTTNYASNSWARGHQIPNADRNNVAEMQAQTYYYTNLTPQIQNGFNGGIWANLEGAVRSLCDNCDTVYVVTGAAFRKKGGSEAINTITDKKNDGDVLPVPNYYWKVLLKVEWSGGLINNASAIGFWLPHADLKDESYSDSKYVVSVDQIETWTGFDFFVNLPTSLQSTAEANTNWSAFNSF